MSLFTRTVRSGLTAFCALSLVAFSAHVAGAAVVLVDDFTDVGSTAWPIVNTTAGSTVQATNNGVGGILGTQRDVSLTLDSSVVAGLDKAEAYLFSGGGFSICDYASTAGAAGTLELEYLGFTSDFTGMNGVRIQLLEVEGPAAQPIVVTVTLWSGAESRTLTANLFPAASQTLDLAFTASVFSWAGLSSVDTFTVEFVAPAGADFRIDRIEINDQVPEPGTLALVALGGAALLRRRKGRRA